MRKDKAIWIRPGFTIRQTMKAVEQYGLTCVKCYDEISTRRRKGWRKVFIAVVVIDVSIYGAE